MTASPPICPYLAGSDGSWREAVASRGQQCSALHPAATLAVEKQRRTCLVAAHRACLTYQVASGSERLRLPDPAGASRPSGVTRWALVRTSPLVLDRGRSATLGELSRRFTPQLGLGALMVLALAAILFARLPATGAAGPGSSLAPDAGVLAVLQTARPSRDEGSRPTPSPSPARADSRQSVSVTTAPSASRSPWASPSATVLTHRVEAGDTLYELAIRFGTTVDDLQRSNDLSSSHLRVGQVLLIP
ncbi:MAG TPA: LysM peptidoglycan-binding domain-containing protein [Vitreimonas sp.]|nr:LysM peptidoglycan-binding domain-containing protein [Vitreimonas sp.]